MSIVAEPFKEVKGLFPEGKIILTDGRVLDCYPLAEQKPEKIESDSLELDRTGQYLIIGINGRHEHAHWANWRCPLP